MTRFCWVLVLVAIAALTLYCSLDSIKDWLSH